MLFDTIQKFQIFENLTRFLLEILKYKMKDNIKFIISYPCFEIGNGSKKIQVIGKEDVK